MSNKTLIINIFAAMLILGFLAMSIGVPSATWDWNYKEQTEAPLF